MLLAAEEYGVFAVAAGLGAAALSAVEATVVVVRVVPHSDYDLCPCRKKKRFKDLGDGERKSRRRDRNNNNGEKKDMRGNQYKDGAWKLWWEKQFLHAATTRNLKYTHKQEVARFFFC